MYDYSVGENHVFVSIVTLWMFIYCGYEVLFAKVDNPRVVVA
jgi:hypothetical protein